MSVELRRLGGLSSALKIMETSKSDEAQERAALAVAGCTQEDDKMCMQLAGLPRDVRAKFVARLESPNSVVRMSVARAIANCTSVEPDAASGAGGEDEAEVDVAEVLLVVGVVPRLVGLLTSPTLALIQSATLALDNMCTDSAAVRREVVKAGGVDALVNVLAYPDKYPSNGDVKESIVSCLSVLAEGSAEVSELLAGNGGMRHLYAMVRSFTNAAGDAQRDGDDGRTRGEDEVEGLREPTATEECAFAAITHCIGASAAAVVALLRLDPRFEALRKLLTGEEDMQCQAMDVLARCADVCKARDAAGAASDATATDADGEALFEGLQTHTAATLVWMLDHTHAHVASRARHVLDVLRHVVARSLEADAAASGGAGGAGAESGAGVESKAEGEAKVDAAGASAGGEGGGEGEGEGSGDRVSASNGRGVDKLTALMATGMVPVLQTLLGSSNEATVEYCDAYLEWLRASCTPGVVAALKSVVGSCPELATRTAVAVALTYLSFGSDAIQSSFLAADDGLGGILGLLRYPSKRAAGIEYLLAIQPIIEPDDDDSDAEGGADEEDDDAAGASGASGSPWSESHINNEADSDLTLLLGAAKRPLYVHKTVLREHSEAVAAMPAAQRDIIEMPEAEYDVALNVVRGMYGGRYLPVWERAAEAVSGAAAAAAAGVKGGAPRSMATYVSAVLHIANQLGVERLQRLASRRLHALVDEHSVATVLAEALEAADLKLCNTCVQFVVDNSAWLFESGGRVEAVIDLLRQLVTETVEGS